MAKHDPLSSSNFARAGMPVIALHVQMQTGQEIFQACNLHLGTAPMFGEISCCV